MLSALIISMFYVNKIDFSAHILSEMTKYCLTNVNDGNFENKCTK